MADDEGRLDLSVVIPAANEAPNLALLLPALRRTLEEQGIAGEVLVVVRQGDAATAAAARAAGAAVVVQTGPGYGGALRSGFARARGAWVLTMDADLSHPPVVAADLWRARRAAAVVVASRYVAGGSAEMPAFRRLLSRLLNRVFAAALGIPVRDLSSGFRLYERRVVAPLGAAATATNFAILQEILAVAHAEGRAIAEIPFAYAPRRHGSSNARMVAFGIEYAVALRRLRAIARSPRPDAAGAAGDPAGGRAGWRPGSPGGARG